MRRGKHMSVIFDTNILMGTESFSKMLGEFSAEKKFISLETLKELDGLKNAEGRKGFQARRAIRKIKENLQEFEIVYIAQEYPETKELRVDDKIVFFAESEGTVLVTNDIAMELNAVGRNVETRNYYEKLDVGNGYHEFEIGLPDGRGVYQIGHVFKEMADKTTLGEYLIIKEFGFPTDIYLREATGFERVDKKELILRPGKGEKVKPKDHFQACAIDSLQNQDFTILTGKAGTGKTYLAVSRMLEALDNGEVNKIVIFTNPTKARGAESLGFYRGDREGKLLQNSIGGILAAKLGGMFILEKMLLEETISIIPMSDIRGIEVGADSYLYITEGQNADADLMQLAIQRGAGCPIIIEGDPFTQLDHWSFGGENNGMLKAIAVFKGFQGFSHVHLPIIYRSAMADRASLMTETPEYMKDGDSVRII